MKLVRSAMCILALVPLAGLASEVPESEDPPDARCVAQLAEANQAAMRVRMLRSKAQYDNVPRTSEFRESNMASAWVQMGLASAQNGLSAYTCSPKARPAPGDSKPTRKGVAKAGPR